MSEIGEIKEAAGEYRKWALEARKKYIELRLRQDPEIRGLYIRAADRVAKELRQLALKTPSSYLRKRQLQELEAALRAEADRLTGNLTKAFEQYIEQAVEAGGGYGQAIALDLFKKAGMDTAGLRTMFATVNRQAVEACWARTKKGLFLSDRIWEQGEKFRNSMRDIIQEAVATGQDAVKTARMLQQYVRQGAMTLARDYPNMMKRMAGRVPGDLCYEALRLARTEMTAAFGEGTIAAARVSPSYIGMKWVLSHSHPVVDICCKAGTMVETIHGPKAIEDISLGDMVLTHKSRWCPVVRLYRQTIRDGAMIRLRCQVEKNHIQEVTLTPNHPVLTEQGWVPAGDLKTGCRMAYSPLMHYGQAYPYFYDVLCKVLLSFGENETLSYVQTFSGGQYDANEHCQHHIKHSANLNFQLPSLIPTFVDDIYQRFFFLLSNWDFWGLVFREIAFAGLLQNEKTSLDVVCHSLGCFCQFLERSPNYNKFAVLCKKKEQIPSCRLGKCEVLQHDQLSNIPWNKIYGLVQLEMSSCKQDKFSQFWLSGCEQHIDGCRNAILQNDQDVLEDMKALQFPYHNIHKFSFYHPPNSSYIDYSILKGNSPFATLINKETIMVTNETVFNLGVAEDNSYTANGVIVHNCDTLAEHDEGLGRGVYSPGDEPPLPAHPNCICTLVPVHEEPEKFVERLKKWRDDPSSDQELEKWYNDIYLEKASEKDKRLVQALRETEAQLIKRKTEKAVVFNDDGSIFFEKEGNENSVTFSVDELQLFEDKILTHNHPRGSSFSMDDVELATFWNFKGIRACGSQYRYYLNRPASGWSREMWKKKIKPLAEKIHNDVFQQFSELIDKGKLTPEEANYRHWHEVWSRVAKEVGLDYGREEW
jgi:hypothetical protein